jgi:predicted phosphodiesterase
LSLTREDLELIVALYKEHGSLNGISKNTGIPRTTVRRHYAAAVRAGLAEPFENRVPEGMEVRTYTTVLRDDEVVLESIKMAPESEQFKGIQPGQKLKGLSTLVDASGRKILEWVKTSEDLSTEKAVEIVQNAFINYKAPTAELKNPVLVDEDRLTLYPELDWHMGLMALKARTGDANWSLDKGIEVIKQGLSELIEMSPPSAHAVVMCLGDLMHSDNSDNRTKKSGNKLDVDGLYDDILFATCGLLIWFLDRLAEKHLEVEVDFKRGNHDEDSTAAIRVALMLRYQHHPRIKINPDGGYFYFRQFGVNLIGGTHGDQQKPSKLPMIMANRMKQAWAETITRIFFHGHIHHETVSENDGVRVISLRAPIPKDDWHAGVGFISGRSLYSWNFHRTLGLRGCNQVEFLA